MQYSVINIFNFIVMVTINCLNYFFKSIYNHLISLILAVRIVFQFRKRCTLPTCAMGHYAPDCWRRFSAGWFSSACSVYAVWTALKKFPPKIELVLSIFLPFVANILSIKLLLRDECDDYLFQNDKNIGQFYRFRKVFTFMNLLCRCDGYVCVCTKNIDNAGVCHCKWVLNFSVHRCCCWFLLVVGGDRFLSHHEVRQSVGPVLNP